MNDCTFFVWKNVCLCLLKCNSDVNMIYIEPSMNGIDITKYGKSILIAK